MQLLLILGVAFAGGAVMFALQNIVPVTVAFAVWRFESSLAVVLLLALGMGIFIAGLVSSPSVIKAKWASTRLRRQVEELESGKGEQLRRIDELQTRLDRQELPPLAAPEVPKPYVGLKAILAGSAASG